MILLGGHYTTLDLMGRIATQFFAVDCVYRKQNNALLEWFIFNNRRQIYDEQIANRDIKKLINRIKAGKDYLVYTRPRFWARAWYYGDIFWCAVCNHYRPKAICQHE